MIRQYFLNWGTYFRERSRAKAYYWPELSARRKVVFTLVWVDVFVNMITGGDPRETISSSLHKDRKSWGAGLLINIVEVFDDDHGESAYQPTVGEGSMSNRELSGEARLVLVLLWATALIVLIRALI